MNKYKEDVYERKRIIINFRIEKVQYENVL